VIRSDWSPNSWTESVSWVMKSFKSGYKANVILLCSTSISFWSQKRKTHHVDRWTWKYEFRNVYYYSQCLLSICKDDGSPVTMFCFKFFPVNSRQGKEAEYPWQTTMRLVMVITYKHSLCLPSSQVCEETSLIPRLHGNEASTEAYQGFFYLAKLPYPLL